MAPAKHARPPAITHPPERSAHLGPVLVTLVAAALALRLVGATYGLPAVFHPDEPTSIHEARALLEGSPEALTFANPPLYKYMLAGLFLALGRTREPDPGSPSSGSPASTLVRPPAASNPPALDNATQPAANHPGASVDPNAAAGAPNGTTPRVALDNPGIAFALPAPGTLLAPTNPSRPFLIARAASAIFGALTVVPVFAIGALLRNRYTGLLAAALASATLLLVRESHFAVNDALATLCSTLALAATIRLAHGGTRRHYLLAGAGAGLAFAAKYQCAIVLLPLLLAHLYNTRLPRLSLREASCSSPTEKAPHGTATPTPTSLARPCPPDKDLLLALTSAVLMALIAFPPLVTETRRVIADVYVFLVLPSRLGFEGLDPSGAYAYYAQSLGWDVGLPTLFLAAIGVVSGVRRRDWRVLIVASLPVVLYIAMGSSKMYVARFMLPGVPALLILAAVAIHDVALAARAGLLSRAARPHASGDFSRAVRQVSLRVPVVVAAGLVALAVLGTLPESLRFDALLSRPDTRAMADSWLAANVPANATVLADPPAFGPLLVGVRVHVIRPPQSHAIYDESLDEYRAQGVQYVITSSFISDAPALDPGRNIRRLEFYSALDTSAHKLVEFPPETSAADLPFVYDRVYGPIDSLDQLAYPGPTLKIYQL